MGEKENDEYSVGATLENVLLYSLNQASAMHGTVNNRTGTSTYGF